VTIVEKSQWNKERMSNSVRKFLASKSVLIFNYSPDLTLCDYFLFPKLKTQLKGKQFDTILDIQKALFEVISTIQKKTQRSFLKLYDRCKHCIPLKGMYVE